MITLSSAQNQNADDEDRPVVRPTGAVTLFNPDGSPAGILHASTLTAFRTALASLCLVQKRNRVHTVTVFGSGEQAYWHVRLALLLRGSTVRHVNVINRRFSPSCKALLKRFHGVPADMKTCEGWNQCAFSILTPSHGEYARLLREQVRAADVIFCCTPSTTALFEGSILTSYEGRRKGRLVVAIGSYTPEMRELPVELLHQATRAHEKDHSHFHEHAKEGGIVVVDTLDGALKEAGEVIDAGLQPTQLAEYRLFFLVEHVVRVGIFLGWSASLLTALVFRLGELVMVRRIAMTEDESSERSSVRSTSTPSSAGSTMSSIVGCTMQSSSRSSSPHRKSGFPISRERTASQEYNRHPEKEDDLARWLQAGNVIYKSVGLGLMDLTVGMHLVKFAEDKGAGAHVPSF